MLWPGMAHRSVRGRIRYTSRKPGQEGVERGREWFAFSHHGDGRVTLRAQCEIEEPAPTVLRDVVYGLDARGRPFDCTVRLSVGDAWMGTGLFRFDHARGIATCDSHGATTGALRQEVALPDGLDGFGTHPIVADGYLTRCIDTSGGPTGRTVRVLLPSPDHRGATPPMLSEVSIDLEYLGDERKTVEAGTFDCRHFRFVDRSATGMGGREHPAYDMWVTADADSVFVTGNVGGYMATWYELVELQR